MELSKKGLWRGIIREFRDFLPDVREDSITTLLEGNTPLVESFNMRDVFGEIRLLFKFEGLNPTCSFKDRGMTMAVTMARQEGTEAVICASTGNTSASAAAYAARAGMKAFVLIPEGGVALGKVSQAIMHGAVVIEVAATFDDLLSIVKEVTLKYPVAIVNSVNP
ncbi:MAG: pyridoxal-phosphate dependent enzyme, partial [Thermodesulfobacteriota bacterium]